MFNRWINTKLMNAHFFVVWMLTNRNVKVSKWDEGALK